MISLLKMNPLSYTYTMKAACSSRLVTIRRLMCMTVAIFALFYAASSTCGAGRRGEAETISDNVESQTSHGTEQNDDNEMVSEIYDLIRNGSEEELRQACLQRGLSTEGDLSTLRNRLFQFEMEKTLNQSNIRYWSKKIMGCPLCLLPNCLERKRNMEDALHRMQQFYRVAFSDRTS